MTTKKRTIYSFETKLMHIKQEEKVAELKWNPKFIESVFNYIISKTEKERVEEKEGEWFFYLANYKIDKRKNDPTHEDCLYGWFESVRIGFRTNLKRRSTMETRRNPKAPDESETHNTYFYIRLKDGLLLLDSYANNVVTYKRLESYLFNKAQNIFNQFKIRHIFFHNLISKGFLDELQKFDVIRLARIRLKVNSDMDYNSSDAIGQLQAMSQYTFSNYIDITMGRKNARKNGLIANHLRQVLKKIMRNKEEVISGTIEGTRSDGGSPTLKLKGIEERYYKFFEVGSDGEVLSDPMFEYMMDIGNTHY